MRDDAIEAALKSAGYRFDAGIGRYREIDAEESDVDYPTEDIADQLGIAVEDLIRWEQGQM